ncbi:ARM repeat-containing protein [Pseudovirgaria hyperparasitica]|uniref:ARM repeat-containing protein n=1 Tax=Pseudovirgaria hyperparasitica TaxID=470096 RepID=A0A6A6VY71_9PEZI|nr:ARM repeat-containing protein [Pseudovirgaria hyperparasitica]KAF2755608.1 ARM repeat-containing protein [Pseudovirgaria hyperparasitica]
MPVTGYDLTSQRVNSELPDLASVLGHIDTTKFLFDDQEDKPVNHHTPVASPDRRSFLHMNTTNDKDNFPILIRREDNNTMQYSALDSATEQSPSTEPQSQTGWSSFASRHRQSQSSLPMNNLHQQLEDLNISSPVERTEPSSRNMAGPGNSRRSSDLKFSPFGQSNRASAHAAQNGSFTMPKLQSSFSTNDIPTVKNPNGINGGQGAITPSTANSHAENHYHNHNASIGRIPTGVPSNRQSRDLTATTTQAEEQRPVTRQSALHASAAPFNSGVASPTNAPAAVNATPNSAMMGPYGAPAFFGGYGMNMMNQQIVPQQGQWAQGAVPQMYQNPYTQYGPTYQAYAAGGRFNDSQPRVIQSRRTAGQEQNRFQDFDLDTQRNEILALCKDQYGCRFLQKKLEERNEDFTLAIFEETKDAVIELMTDPFGNYLCQKLLEYTKDDQRTVLIKNAAPSMVGIALNQHGTRALQKMIEYILNAEQISTIIEALQSNVVALIQDLNGNHVIQKCLNHLKPQDAQFIFSAVGNNCVEVGTHRHGCCVLQRCIDHASGDQKNMLIHQISESSIKLVQDPFGNYVVQYILDLAEQKFTHPLCVKFMGRVVELSKQKFSSNVIEKCIRVAAHEIKRVMIDEILLPGELEGVMRDPYANYVIQTALDYADNDTCIRLIDAMRPIIPGIRQTPYGRRIQTKIQDREARLAQGSGPALIDPQSLATSPMTSPHASQAVPYNPNIQSPQNPYVGLANGYQSPQRIGNPTQPGFQNSQHQSFGRAAASYGMNGGNMNSNAGGMGNNMGYF